MKKRIVVVEDFNTSRQIIKKALEKKFDCIIEEASDGREAMKFFNGETINLLITDYNMPNMNGAELVEYVRSKKEYQYIPILMLSTETNTEKQKRAKDAKITGWVQKPFDFESFIKIIEKVL